MKTLVKSMLVFHAVLVCAAFLLLCVADTDTPYAILMNIGTVLFNVAFVFLNRSTLRTMRETEQMRKGLEVTP